MEILKGYEGFAELFTAVVFKTEHECEELVLESKTGVGKYDYNYKSVLKWEDLLEALKLTFEELKEKLISIQYLDFWGNEMLITLKDKCLKLMLF
ncbi:hypothetical protein FDB15_03995 [Clostridium botulinum]|uniref:hypothetical protein n=1 Tax=unclassified Clostridium TaxID=2614128 RepID=UPI0013CAEECD|nr:MULTISPECIES: hypothetical protein [unclassified Clostridium]NFH99490.1 hypothetical protein [Clostridium botulinum]NFI62175.1 hypothetical protein [Clostridium botulinum]NFJ42619.1 hypothetical protein [Clostridium botulinum]NFJ46510.1 hypothetical protein [Clostridium botulinum]NFK26448.1 hypothetical protein [Clostridium botulinum]